MLCIKKLMPFCFIASIVFYLEYGLSRKESWGISACRLSIWQKLKVVLRVLKRSEIENEGLLACIGKFGPDPAD